MTFLAWVGRHASALLILGFLAVPFVPVSPETLKPLLPPLVVLVTALGFARQPLDRTSLKALLHRRTVGLSLGWLIVTQVLATVLVIALGHRLGVPQDVLILLAAFFAAPPLSSAPNICLILRYDYAMALRLSVLGTLAAPVFLPLALTATGLAFDASGWVMGLRVLGMLGAGIALGIAVQLSLGPARMAHHGEAFNGLAALAMIGFLFPLLSGAKDAIRANPGQALTLLALVFALNIGGHLVVRRLGAWRLPPASAAALGYIFGNRNLSLVLASVPFDPTLTLFVALMQAPIYATPALFSLAKRTKTP